MDHSEPESDEETYSLQWPLLSSVLRIKTYQFPLVDDFLTSRHLPGYQTIDNVQRYQMLITNLPLLISSDFLIPE